MANGTFYVRSAAAGAADGSSWANAYTALATATAANTGGGDTFYVADDHAEAPNADITIVGATTAGNPSKIICVNTHTTAPPTGLATTGAINQTGTNSDIFFTGFGYCYGVIFNCGNASNNTISWTSTSAFAWKLEACLLRLNTTGTGAKINIGANSASSTDSRVDWVNCTTRFGHVSQTINVKCPFTWKFSAGAVSASGSAPTTLFTPIAGNGGTVECIGLDLAFLGSGNSLVNVGQTNNSSYLFQDCKLGASAAITTGTVPGAGGTNVVAINCDSGDTNYKLHMQNYFGTITHDITVIRTGGATDGVTPISRKMVTTANASFLNPLESRPIFFWNDTVGSVAIEVPIVTDNVTLTDAEAWIDVQYLGTSGFPLALKDTDRATDIFATPANQTTDGVSSWPSAPGTPVKQTLAKTVSAAEKGMVAVRVVLAKASTTMYYDPLILASSSRQYQTFAGYINEPPASGGGLTQTSHTFGA